MNISAKKISSIIITVIALIIIVSVFGFRSLLPRNYSRLPGHYDMKGNKYFNDSDVVFYTPDGTEFTYDFDKTGYDYLYSKDGDKLNSDLCYLDENGYLYYDDDMSVVASGKSSCVDVDKTVYYPVKYSSFTKIGKIEYYHNSFSYDRLGNAYTYEFVPYYDKDGNKYQYSFDSSSLRGVYTNITTGESYENEKCFVDVNGYLVYDENGEFVKTDNTSSVYKDSAGDTYYWASGINFDSEGNIVDI